MLGLWDGFPGGLKSFALRKGVEPERGRTENRAARRSDLVEKLAVPRKSPFFRGPLLFANMNSGLENDVKGTNKIKEIS